jgi:diguanylate cyclase (GGDEF)-like protein/PAS domain S-box-containing protein
VPWADERIKRIGLATAVEQAADGIVVTDAEGRIQFANPAFTTLTGYAIEEVLGKTPRVLKSGRHSLAFYKELWATIQAGKIWQGEVINKRKDGSEYTEEMRIAPIRDQGGEIVGHIAIKRDITGRIVAEESLRFLAAIVESSEDGIVAYTPDGTIVTWNRGAEAIFGYSAAEAIGKNASTFVPPEWYANLRSANERIMRGESSVQQERLGLRKDGRRIHLSVTSWPIRNAIGEVSAVSIIVRDVSKLRQAEEARTLLASIVDSSDDAIHAISPDGIISSWNKGAESLFGFANEEVIGKDVGVLVPLSLRRETRKYVKTIDDGCSISPFDTVALRKDGSEIDVSLSISPIRNSHDQVIGASAIARDISKRKQIEQELCMSANAVKASEERYRMVFQTNLDAIAINRLDDGKYIDVNPAFLGMTGFKREEVVGNTSLDLHIWMDLGDRQKLVDTLHRTSECRNLETQFRKKNAEGFWGLMSASVIQIDGISCILSVTRDISEAKANQDEIKTLAFYDQLTGLPNRRLLLDRLRQTSRATGKNGSKRALLYIDLDDFKTLNDTLGHRIGDLLLIEVAHRISRSIRQIDTAARLAGDEFVVMLEGLSEIPEKASAQAREVSEKVRAALSQPYLLDSRECRSTCSIGVTVFGDELESSDEVLQHSDIAMYQAKASGRNAVRFFAPALQAAIHARAVMEKELRRGIATNQFVLYYQPQIDCDRLVGAEALLRWQHPDRGILMPDAFIPLAEDTGLILPLGAWVLETACKQIAFWGGHRETAHISVAVNVSALQLRQPDFVETVLEMLDRTGANPQKLDIEITESTLVGNIGDVIGKMTRLKSQGVRFSVDDFGTGYSSLAYLKCLPLDQLKIDRSFVRDIVADPCSTAIAQTIISLSQALSLSVIAEGVETEEQRALLARLGCSAFQGYLCSRPLPAKDFQILALGLFHDFAPMPQ